MKPIQSLPLFAATALVLSVAAHAQEKSLDNGTDPTVLSRQFAASYEHLNLTGGLTNDALKLSYYEPFGADKKSMVRLRLPVTRVTGLGGDENFDIGDASVMLTHVFGVTRAGGYVVQGELVLDTAARAELGNGKNVFKGTLIAAYFLKDGSIFAPAIVQSNSLSGDANRAKVNATTLDFYYVPKMADARNLVTYDPSVNFDWESKKNFAGLAVTFGRVVGPAFGGNAVVSVKPSVFAGGDRPATWGLEVSCKVIGF